MNERTLRFGFGRSWGDEMAENAAMFREADLLEEAAYRIIEHDADSPEAWARFSEAKALADAKRTAAYQDWMRIKRAMSKPRSK
ncbi:hypothetical protein [Pseudomonas siliginis]|jgi:hypothetical protein|uniref:hypothetical protein n=1 Tax=Pseudomonas siliginis TaxID=2842346 RepID=UPI0020938CC0|nr:hypothetical protein [Pseudomonas siliginis]UST98431.1 hypothetical protein NF680_14595 [Pseudomonas siliginis]